MCHPAGCYGCYDIAYYIVLVTLFCERLSESNLGKFRGGVVALTKAAKQTCSRRCVDDPAIFLFSKVWPRSSGTLDQGYQLSTANDLEGMTYFVRALHMNLDN